MIRSSLSDRFWSKVDKRGPEECWLWLGGKDRYGYGKIRRGGSGEGHLKAHRVAWELAHGPIPPGLLIDHVKARGCTRRDCCNEAHLEPVTNRENTLRGDAAPARNVSKTHCPLGHPYDRVYKGFRLCRRCTRAAGRRYHARSRREAVAA